MSGHSKWNNIKNKKEKTDAQKAKIFTKIGKEIAICVRDGGGDPNTNGKLRDLIAKAKANNVPNDNIERAIKKATGADAVQYEEITYEGYGPSGVAVIVEAATDSRNRTASDVRHYFDKYGGNLGSNGCVSYMFEDKGVIILLREDNEGVDEDQLMEDALEASGMTTSAESMGITEEMMQEMYADLGDLPISLWIDGEGYVRKYEMDMTEMMQKIMDESMKAMGMAEEDIAIDIEKTSVVMVCSDFNDVEEIEIPADALAFLKE